MNSETYSLVVDAHGNPAFDDDGNVLSLRESDGDVGFMEYATAVVLFPSLHGANADCLASQTVPPLDRQIDSPLPTGLDKPSQSSEGRCSWDKSEITELIRLYKSHLPQFKSTTLKNEKVWQMIGDHLPNHTVEQIKNKFKYLKQKYTDKKDNMKSKSSGAAAIKFAYFDEMDEIFGKDANICPPSTASSSRGSQNFTNIEVDDSDNSSTVNDDDHIQQNLERPKKRKKSQLGAQLSTYEENVKLKEIAKQTRHNELMQRQDAALELLKVIADSFSKMTAKKP